MIDHKKLIDTIELKKKRFLLYYSASGPVFIIGLIITFLMGFISDFNYPLPTIPVIIWIVFAGIGLIIAYSKQMVIREEAVYLSDVILSTDDPEVLLNDLKVRALAHKYGILFLLKSGS